MKVEIKDTRKDKPKGEFGFEPGDVYRVKHNTILETEAISIVSDDNYYLIILDGDCVDIMDKDVFTDEYTLVENITNKVKITITIS